MQKKTGTHSTVSTSTTNERRRRRTGSSMLVEPDPFLPNTLVQTSSVYEYVATLAPPSGEERKRHFTTLLVNQFGRVQLRRITDY